MAKSGIVEPVIGSLSRAGDGVADRGRPRRSGVGRPASGVELVTLSPVARETLQAQAYNKLREALMSGLFSPGQSITLRSTAEALGTSPMPVRDALRRLEIEHALVPRSNRTLGVPEMTYASLIELREVRMALEGLAAEKAAALVSADEVKKTEHYYQAMAAAAEAGDPGEYMRSNWAFHSSIYRASRSELLVSLIEPTWMRIGPYVRVMLPDRQSLIASLGSHADALQGMKRGDSEVTKQAIMRDIWESAEGLADMLRAQAEVMAEPAAAPRSGQRPKGGAQRR